MNFGGSIHLNKPGIVVIAALILIFVYVYSGNIQTGRVPASVKINLRQLLQVAIKAAENGGVEVVAAKDNLRIDSKGLTKEGMQDTVTTADFLSHCSMVATLHHAFPTIKLFSEEAKAKCDGEQKIDYLDIESVPKDEHWEEANDITVWIDPLDATHEYTEKLYEYVTTMVCVAVKGKPVIGVIHKPFLNKSAKTFWAWVGKDKSSNLIYEKPKSQNTVIISRSHSGDIRKVLDSSFNIVVAAGSGYKSLEVASGTVDAYLHITAIKKWDICAGNAIINAMGGKMTTKYNEVIDYTDSSNVQNERGLVATINNHDLFIEKIQ